MTSRSRTSSAFSPGAASACAWMAAPSATTSSGWTPRHGSRPKNSLTACCTRGMRVMPPTRITSPTCAGRTPASFSVRSRHLDAALDEVLRELLELLAGELPVEVERALPVAAADEERQVDRGARAPTTARTSPSRPRP